MDSGSVAVMTLGGQPQIITLLLDCLRRRGELIDEVIVVHLAFAEPRLRSAHEKILTEFVGDRFGGSPCHLISRMVRLKGQPVLALNSEDALDAVRDTFAELFAAIKARRRQIHLGLSGGPRLLGHMAIAEAQRQFQHLDRVWHLQTPRTIQAQVNNGAVMHLDDPAITLLRIHLAPNGIALQSPESLAEHRNCQRVWDTLTPAQRNVLRTFARGMSPDEVALALSLSTATVDSHKSKIYQICIAVWELAPDTRLHYSWLREHFADFL